MPESNVPIVINNVSKSFKKKVVLDNVSLTIEKGQIFGLIGLNGIGKTTLIKILLNLLNADAGEILIFGQPHYNMPVKQLFTYLPEKFMPSSLLLGEEFLRISNGYYGLPYIREDAIKLCEELGLEPSALDRKIGSYSKGMGQKLGLISIFLLNRPLLILDEPMSGLDPSARIMLKNKLKLYREQGKTVFFSSHILADIEAICDSIAVIHDGVIKYAGNVENFVHTYPSDNLEQSFLNAITK